MIIQDIEVDAFVPYTLRVYGDWVAAEYESDGPGGTVLKSPEGYVVNSVSILFGEREIDITNDISDAKVQEIEQRINEEEGC